VTIDFVIQSKGLGWVLFLRVGLHFPGNRENITFIKLSLGLSEDFTKGYVCNLQCLFYYETNTFSNKSDLL